MTNVKMNAQKGIQVVMRQEPVVEAIVTIIIPYVRDSVIVRGIPASVLVGRIRHAGMGVRAIITPAFLPVHRAEMFVTEIVRQNTRTVTFVSLNVKRLTALKNAKP
jgi:hypothetical protein